MMFSTTLLSCVLACSAGNPKLDWEDCGDATTHVIITDLSPDELAFGATTTVTGSGILDETQDGGNFKFKATLAGVPVTTGSGDLCKGADLKLPLGVGEITIKPLACPVMAGDASVVLDITLANALTQDVNSLVKVDLTATTTSGDKLFCMKINIDTPKQFTGVDCSTAVCKSDCECSNDKCATELDTCLSDATCTKAQDCALACPCHDNACVLKCAAGNPSVKALPAALCINKECGSSLRAAADVDCSTAACPDQCQCGLDKCADAIDTCLADATCAKGQDCALACACSDTACELKCAAANPSTKALPVATCLNKNCASVVV